MTAEQLRNSILQEAISGRLVPQDPNDEPAAIVSTVPEDEIPFDVPASWRWIRMKDCAAIIGGYAFPSASIKGEKGVRVIRISDISEKGFVNKSVVRYNGHENLDKFKIIPQDILIAMTGGTVGKSLFVQQMGEDMLLNQRVAIIRNNGQFAPYIDIVVKSPHIKSFINDKKNSTNDNISMGDINSFLVPLPPLAEQKRIVAKLEELLPIVEQYGKAQKELDELNAALPTRLRQSILQEAISGRLVPQDPNDEPASVLLQHIREERECLFKAGKIKKKDYHIYDISDEEIPFELPQGWAWEKLGNLTEIISDGTHKTPHYVESGIPFLSVQNISGGQLDLSKIKYITQAEHEELIKRVKPQKGDLLICRIGTLGKAIKIYWDFEFSIFVSLGLIRLVDSSLANYISLIINSPIGNSWIQENKVGGGTHTFKINLGDIPNMMLPLPPLAEQQRIVAKIEELFAEIDKIRK